MSQFSGSLRGGGTSNFQRGVRNEDVRALRCKRKTSCSFAFHVLALTRENLALAFSLRQQRCRIFLRLEPREELLAVLEDRPLDHRWLLQHQCDRALLIDAGADGFR